MGVWGTHDLYKVLDLRKRSVQAETDTLPSTARHSESRARTKARGGYPGSGSSLARAEWLVHEPDKLFPDE